MTCLDCTVKVSYHYWERLVYFWRPWSKVYRLLVKEDKKMHVLGFVLCRPCYKWAVTNPEAFQSMLEAKIEAKAKGKEDERS